MTIKALNGGKLLCLMAAVAGTMTLGSCKEDDDKPAPAPADTTQKVVAPNEYYFSLNDSTPDTLNAGDTIKANTLLADGANSDSISIKVVLRNNTMVDPASVSFTVSNQYLGETVMQDRASIADSVFSVTFPAIEGKYYLSINGESKNFIVAGTGKALSANYRNLSNYYIMDFSSDNAKLSDLTFTPYSETKEGIIYVAKLSGDGKFVALTEDDYNNYISGDKLRLGALEDIDTENWEASIFNADYFAYQSGEKIYLGKVLSFVGESLREASSIKVAFTY